MLSDTPFTKENLNNYLKELAKEFRKLNGKKIPAEIILIGGAAVLANYGFRDMTYDIDAVVTASSAMKDAINHVGDRLGLPNNWLNADFKKTDSYSDKLLQVSVYYKTFSNFESEDYKTLFLQNRESEQQSKEILLDFEKTYPGELKTANIDAVLEKARKKRQPKE